MVVYQLPNVAEEIQALKLWLPLFGIYVRVKIKEEPVTAAKEDEDQKEIAKVKQESETDIKPKTENDTTIEQDDDIDKSLIQLNVSHEELQRRIQKFIESKREQVNLSNVHDFLPNKGQGDDSCARVQTQFVRRSDSKGHLKIHRVFNEWGPQTAKTKMRVMEDEGGLPIGIAERVTDIEKYVNINPVSKDIFQRLKDMENRLAVLESVSPEYKSFWKQNSAESCTDNTETKPYVFSSDDITRKIEQLEQESYEHY